MYCPNCGSDNQSEVRFCRRCGTGLEAVSLALSGKGEDRPLAKSQLARLIKDYYSGRFEMIGGLGAVAIGIAVPAALLATGRWVFFWIFVWFFLALFGNGVHQFTKGWKEWNEASSELKVMGYDGPPTNKSHMPENNPGKIGEPRSAEPLQPSGTGVPPSVTESTTRDLDTGKMK